MGVPKKLCYTLFFLMLCGIGIFETANAGMILPNASIRQQLFNRESYLLFGPIQEEQIEAAAFTMNQSMQWVPTNRHLTLIRRFDLDGFLTESETYNLQGSLTEKSIYTRTGDLITLQTVYDTNQTVIRTHDYSYTNQKMSAEVVKDGSGKLLERWEYTYPAGMIAEIKHYGPTENLLDWSQMIEETPGKATVYAYDGSNKLLSKSIHDIQGNERESIFYDGDLMFQTRYVYLYDSYMNPLELTSYDDTQSEVLHNIYEYSDWDQYNNWLSQKLSMALSLDAMADLGSTGEIPGLPDSSMPLSITYRTFKYESTTGVEDFCLY